MTIAFHFPSKIKLAFIAVYSLLGLTLAFAIFTFGKQLGWEHKTSVPVYCKGTPGFDRCLEKVVASQGAAGASASCDKVGLGYLCTVSVSGSCFAVTAKRTSEGFPVTETVAAKTC